MNYTQFFCHALATTVLTAATFAASAQAAQTSVSTDAGAQVQASAGNTDSDVRGVAETHPFCLQQTGSRLVGSRIVAHDKSAKRCSNFGRVYTQDDIERTGAVDLADALRKLDPAIR
ncbi:MAG: hypothetical protein WKF61_07085 [Luteimonas sp.]